jgi:hypothetical protein
MPPNNPENKPVSSPSAVLRSRPIIEYRLHTTAAPPQVRDLRGVLYDYVLAANGLFVHARRVGLEVNIPVVLCEVRGGLQPLDPFVRLDYPKIGRHLLTDMLNIAQNNRDVSSGEMLETLFWFMWNATDEDWQLIVPPQQATPATVYPLPIATGPDGHYGQVLLEVHTHPRGPTNFSSADDADERTGFRMYGVLSGLNRVRPFLRLRVGVHGYFLEIPASGVFEME